MRARVGVGASLAIFFVMGVAACGFGVDLDGLFGDPADSGPSEGGLDGGGPDAQPEAGIPSVQVESIALGTNFGCGRRIDGTVMCWGQATGAGELGDGLKVSSSKPVLVKDVTDAVDLGVGQHHACIVHKSGTVSCWGENEGRQLGDGTTTDSLTPKDVIQLTDAQHLALGDGFSCALRKDGSVHCWGDNAAGQLGDGTVTPRSQPAPVSMVAGATQIAATYASACALVKGEVLCWGRNAVGETGAMPPTDTKTPVKVAGLTGVVSIAASADAGHFCAVLTAGDLRCWGRGGSGQLGNAKTANSFMPVTPLSINDAMVVTTGGDHTCAARKGGGVSCWGSNSWQQLGLGAAAPTDDVSSPLPVNGLSGVKQVVAGENHTCALSTDGLKITCWGTNVGHGLGRGTRVNASVPVKVVTGTLASFTLGDEHTCAIDTKGTLDCWGNNELRQLSVTTFLATGTPTLVPSVAGVTRASAGNLHTCALTGGQVLCWGNGQYGQLGNGSAPYIQEMPVTYGGPGPKTDVGAGSSFTCTLLASKDITCTGSNEGSRLGFSGSGGSSPFLLTGTADPDAGAEAGVPSFGADKISVGPGHTCAIRSGNLTCWGFNGGGECGASKSYERTPTAVSLPQAVSEVASGGGHTCVVLGDGSVRCWGYNNHGQVTGGDPDGPLQRTPNLGGKKAKTVVAGDEHACALLSDETVLCWGRGTDGQLGNGVLADATTPVAVMNLVGVKSLAAGGRRTCAVVADGSGYCWGDNRSGELGDGVVMTAGVPASVVGY